LCRYTCSINERSFRIRRGRTERSFVMVFNNYKAWRRIKCFPSSNPLPKRVWRFSRNVYILVYSHMGRTVLRLCEAPRPNVFRGPLNTQIMVYIYTHFNTYYTRFYLILFNTCLPIMLINSLQILTDKYEGFSLPWFPYFFECSKRNGSNWLPN